MDIIEQDEMRKQVRDRYGKIAEMDGRDSRTSGAKKSCCSGETHSPTSVDALGYDSAEAATIPEGSEMGLGCGNPTAHESIKSGETVVDLGSGGGFDCFLISKRVGEKGVVIGVDMTPEMVSKARAIAVKHDYKNVVFRLGEIEALPVADASVDLVISNCVINLSPDKPQVYREIFRVLKPGGRISVSDIVATTQIPADLKTDFAAYTGCIAGASSKDELENVMRKTGFTAVNVNINEKSREFINDWIPGKNAGRYVASAAITAVKPV